MPDRSRPRCTPASSSSASICRWRCSNDIPGSASSHPGAAAEIKRVDRIWCEARERWGKKAGGPYLFGHFTVADAMYSPVVTRFQTYAVHVNSMCHNYMEAILNDPDFLAWEAQAELDPPPEPLPA